MIHLIIGRQGSGKTLLIVKMAYDAYKKGKTVYSNVALKFPFKKLNYNDIVECKLKNAFVIIDEIHLLLPSRNCMSRRNRLICDGFLSMVRKQNLDVAGTTQTERKVDVRFREEKDYFYECERFAYLNNMWVLVPHNDALPSTTPILINVRCREEYSLQWVSVPFMGNKYFDLYDTSQVIHVTGIDADDG